MPKPLIKSRLHFGKAKPNSKRKLENTTPPLPISLPTYKQKLLSGSGFIGRE